MQQATHRLEVRTRGQGLYDVTRQITSWVNDQQFSTGLLTVFIQHTSASLTIQENADPDVIHDLNQHFIRLVPEDNRLYRHTIEGPDDMPAHIRAALTDVSLSIPLANGKLALGTWQGVYVFEHRTHPHTRVGTARWRCAMKGVTCLLIELCEPGWEDEPVKPQPKQRKSNRKAGNLEATGTRTLT